MKVKIILGLVAIYNLLCVLTYFASFNW